MANTLQELHPILQADTELFLYLNNLGQQKFDALWMWITNKETWYIFYLILVLTVIAQLKNWKKILIFCLVSAAMVAFVDFTTSSLFKPFIGRFRPCHEPYLDGLVRLVKPNCGGKYSFFSGHSSNSFAIAMFIGYQLKKYPIALWLLLIWAATIAYSRIYVGVHYPLDVLAGSTWGAIFGYLFYRLYQFLVSKFAV